MLCLQLPLERYFGLLAIAYNQLSDIFVEMFYPSTCTGYNKLSWERLLFVY